MVSIVFENTIERAYVGRMLPTLRQLHYLKLLAEHASFSRAAEAAHVSQPALSAGVLIGLATLASGPLYVAFGSRAYLSMAGLALVGGVTGLLLARRLGGSGRA